MNYEWLLFRKAVIVKSMKGHNGVGMMDNYGYATGRADGTGAVDMV